MRMNARSRLTGHDNYNVIVTRRTTNTGGTMQILETRPTKLMTHTRPEILLQTFLLRHSVASANTRRSYQNDIREYLTFCQQNALRFNTHESINGYVQFLCHRIPTLKPRTINRKLAANSSLVSFMLTQTEGKNHFHAFKKLKVPVSAVHFEENDIGALIEVIEAEEHPMRRSRDLAIFHLLIETGFRMQTIVNLTVNDVAIDSDGLMLFTVREKGGKVIRRAVRPETKDLIFDYLRYIRPYLLFPTGNTDQPHAQSDRLFRSFHAVRRAGGGHTLNVNGQLGLDGLRKIFRTYARRINLNASIHILRAFSGFKVYKKFGILAAQNQLGHSSPRITENYIRKFFRYDKTEILTAFD